VSLSVKERQRLKVLGDKVRRERCAQGLTQDKLAEISTRNLQKVEAGELNILFTTIVRIRLALICT
jgi:transcriptional regulator with XRE-family HTH domain